MGRLNHQYSSDDVVEIALGSLDEDVPVLPDAHILVGSGANWTVSSDDLPRFVEGRDSARVKKLSEARPADKVLKPAGLSLRDMGLL